MSVKKFSNTKDYDDQQTILGILLKIKDSDPSLTLAEAAVILCEHFDLEYSEFSDNCGDVVKEFIRRDAIANKQLRGYTKKKRTIDDLFQ